MKLNELVPGRRARISAIGSDADGLGTKLREIGFSEGDEVELVGVGPFGGKTLAVRLNRSLIALRTGEASYIEVDPE